MIAELQQAVAKYAHALDELNVPEREAEPREGVVEGIAEVSTSRDGDVLSGGRTALR